MHTHTLGQAPTHTQYSQGVGTTPPFYQDTCQTKRQRKEDKALRSVQMNCTLILYRALPERFSPEEALWQWDEGRAWSVGVCACVGAGGCADGTGRRGVECSAGSVTFCLTSLMWSLRPKGHQGCCDLQPPHCFRFEGRCVCPRALKDSSWVKFVLLGQKLHTWNIYCATNIQDITQAGKKLFCPWNETT